jgi:hypothetical protein
MDADGAWDADVVDEIIVQRVEQAGVGATTEHVRMRDLSFAGETESDDEEEEEGDDDGDDDGSRRVRVRKRKRQV